MLPDDPSASSQAPHTALDAERLVTALEELEPRPARLLELRLLHGKTDAQVAEHYGMPQGAYEVHLLRAARMFMAAYMPEWGHAERNVPVEVEQNEGAQLAAALTSAGNPGVAVAELAKALRHLMDHAAAVRARMEQLQKAEAASPAAHRETLIRRALIAILVAVTLYLYFTRPPGP